MASLVEKQHLVGHLNSSPTLHVTLGPKNNKLTGTLVKNAHDAMDYSGKYEVVSQINVEQSLETAKRYLSRNIIVKAIPYAEVSNLSGGKTITIGG